VLSRSRGGRAMLSAVGTLAADGRAEVPGRRVYVWNEEVHRSREVARLQFWRLAFAPNFDRRSIFEELRQLAEQVGITSYIAYEAFGNYDLLLRAWVPRTVDPEDVGLRLEKALEPHSLWEYDYFSVQSTDLHWAWQNVGGRPSVPVVPLSDELQLVNNALVDELGAYNDRTMRSKDGSVVEPPDWVASFESKNLIRELPLDSAGVRFFITFDHPRRLLRRAERELVIKQLRDKCTAVVAATHTRLRREEPIQLTMYSGTGPMTEFLIIARAPDGDFYRFARDLVFGLHEVGLHRTHHMRTYTYVLADRNFAVFRDLPLADELEVDASLLELPESESLEFKASYAMDVRRFIATGEMHESQVIKDNIIKAVCGLLNAPSGGRLVIGVLEIDRELERLKDPSVVRARIEAAFPIYKSIESGPSAAGEAKALTGVDDEFGGDWDKFLRALLEALRHAIQPSPLAFVGIEQLKVQGRTLAVVNVRPSDTWFYANVGGSLLFYVRELAATRAYAGPESDLYRRANPRPGSGA
jgi:hypothetical protein